MKMTTKHIILKSIVIATISLFSAQNASALEIEGTLFPDEHQYQNIRMKLKGAALLRYLSFFKAYTGAFYMPENRTSDEALFDIPKHLVLEYRVAISATDFAEATTESIRKNLGQKEFQRLLPKIQVLNGLYQGVNPGDQYSLTYIPGHGTELRLNRAPLGVIPGPDFAFAVFSIWIGEAPIDISFKQTLLGMK